MSQSEERSVYEVVPYVPRLDPNSQVFIPYLYLRMREEGLLNVYFHDFPSLTFPDFVAALSTPTAIHAMVVRKGDPPEHVGFASLTERVENEVVRRGVGGFVFFRDFWNGRDTVGAARAILTFWFEKLKLDVVAGMTPVKNRAALAFVMRMGFVRACEVPEFCAFEGERIAARVSYMTRAHYEKEKASWERSNGQGT